jgi:hypothetical protein
MRIFVSRLIAYLAPAARWLGFPYYIQYRGPER